MSQIDRDNVEQFVHENNKRLAKNTIFLYVRMLLLMFVGLYSSRVILQTLGVQDYGLYNVVGGFVTMFSFLNASLSTSTQRFLNIEIGNGDINKIADVFSGALLLHFILAIVILLLAETVGLWFVTEKLIIADGREQAAFWVYQFSIIAIVVQIIQLPFMSTIIAHEKMNVYAYVSIYEAFAKLGVLFLILYINTDKLILYGFLFLCVQISVVLFYNVYCRMNFLEARFRVIYQKKMFKEMLKFSGWNVTGNLAYVLNSQGQNILLNLFFGTAINAARGIAFQVHGLFSQLINGFQIAVKPQVIKYYASGNYEEMTNLVFNSAKFSAYLVMAFSIPIIIEIKPLLNLWLGDYPDYAPIFIQIILFRAIITSMTGNIIMVVHASGYLKNVSIYAGGVLLLVLPISYVLLKLGCSPIVPFALNIVGALGECFFELYWMNNYINFPMINFYKEVYGKVFSLYVVALALPAIIHYSFSGFNQYLLMLVVAFFSICTSSLLIYFYGIDTEMRKRLHSYLKSKLHIQLNTVS